MPEPTPVAVQIVQREYEALAWAYLARLRKQRRPNPGKAFTAAIFDVVRDTNERRAVLAFLNGEMDHKYGAGAGEMLHRRLVADFRQYAIAAGLQEE